MLTDQRLVYIIYLQSNQIGIIKYLLYIGQDIRSPSGINHGDIYRRFCARAFQKVSPFLLVFPDTQIHTEPADKLRLPHP